MHTAIDAYNLGYHIQVVEPAVASISVENHKFALNHLQNVLGSTIIETI